MSDIERVIRASKSLEKLLEQQYGATGRGLHEKASNVEDQLDSATLKSLRWVATMRNKVVHEDDFDLPDPIAFDQTVQKLRQQLNPAPSPSIKPQRPRKTAQPSVDVNDVMLVNTPDKKRPIINNPPVILPKPSSSPLPTISLMVILIAILWMFLR